MLACGISFWQACIAGLIGIIVSFLLVGFVAAAGKRGSAPTLVLSRAAFGVQGNKLPALISWVLNVGWEIVLTGLATLATATVFHRLGWSSGDLTKVIAFLVLTVLIVGSAALGFDTIMRVQVVITWVTGILTVIYFILVADKIHWSTVSGLHSGSAQAFLGATVLVITGFGLGGKAGTWEYANLGVIVALAFAFLGWLALGRAAVRRQEAAQETSAASAAAST